VGHWIERLRVPLPHDTSADHKTHGWQRWAEGVARRPVLAVVGAVLLLAVIAWPVLDMQLGQEDDSALPTSTETRQAYDLTTEGFGVGDNGPFLVAVDVGNPKDVDSLNKAVANTRARRGDPAGQQTAAIQRDSDHGAVGLGHPGHRPTQNDTILNTLKGLGSTPRRYHW
jgi:RND superfamily putative drug exporter